MSDRIKLKSVLIFHIKSNTGNDRVGGSAGVNYFNISLTVYIILYTAYLFFKRILPAETIVDDTV
jgi:hypothetical protein